MASVHQHVASAQSSLDTSDDKKPFVCDSCGHAQAAQNVPGAAGKEQQAAVKQEPRGEDDETELLKQQLRELEKISDILAASTRKHITELHKVIAGVGEELDRVG